MAKYQITKTKYQRGQTLIETIVAIFLIATALTSGVGLAIYALSTSADVENQITAVNLAREGIEVVRMMRDSNWLASDAISSDPGGDAYALQPCSDIADKFCYPLAYEAVPGHNDNFSLPFSGEHRLYFDPANASNADGWDLQNGFSFSLYQQSDGTYTHVPCAGCQSTFSRKLVFARNIDSPFSDVNSNWELIVQSIVGWQGRRCLPMTGGDPATTNCKIIVEEHLTNWKDYK